MATEQVVIAASFINGVRFLNIRNSWTDEYPNARILTRRKAYEVMVNLGLDLVVGGPLSKPRLVENYGLENEEWEAISETAHQCSKLRTKYNVPRITRSTVGPAAEALDALVVAMHNVVDARTALHKALQAYELTGDHAHGSERSIPRGGSCPGGDCWVHYARQTLELLGKLDVQGRVKGDRVLP